LSPRLVTQRLLATVRQLRDDSATVRSTAEGLDGGSVVDGADDLDDVPDMFETVWSADGCWTGDVEVAISQSPEGDAIVTLPRSALMGHSLDGRAIDVAVPLDLMRWIVAEAGRLRAGHSEGSPS
jgi:hypothetical protein